MTTKNIQVLTIGPNNGVRVYTSIRAASRALSGTGSDEKRSTIARRIYEGGGYIGDVFVSLGSVYNRT